MKNGKIAQKNVKKICIFHEIAKEYLTNRIKFVKLILLYELKWMPIKVIRAEGEAYGKLHRTY